MNILEEATAVVNGQRREDYGDMTTSFERIAAFWSTYTGVALNSVDVCNMMILLKVSRAMHNNQRDSYLDIAGYVACADTLIHER